ncbi:MAG: hypothetical protein ACHQQQ_10340 [Bacteroidota bacterium]
MTNIIVTLLLLTFIHGTNPSAFAQKHKKSPKKAAAVSHTAPSRGFSTTLIFKDSKGEQIGQPVKFGIHLDATYCVDMKLGESFVPPLPPAGIPDVRFMDPRPGASCMDLGISNDFRPYQNSAQVDTYMVNMQPSTNGFPVTVSWTKLKIYYTGSVTLTDAINGELVKIDMKKDTSAMITKKLQSLLIIAKKPVNPLKVK